MRPPAEQLIRDYLNRLSVAARTRLQSDDRRAFLARTREYIERQSGARDTADPAVVMRILSSLGEPETAVERESARLAAVRGERAAAAARSGLWKSRAKGNGTGENHRPGKPPANANGAEPSAEPRPAPSPPKSGGRDFTGEIVVTSRPISARRKPGAPLKEKQTRQERAPRFRRGGARGPDSGLGAPGPDSGRAAPGPDSGLGAPGPDASSSAAQGRPVAPASSNGTGPAGSTATGLGPAAPRGAAPSRPTGSGVAPAAAGAATPPGAGPAGSPAAGSAAATAGRDSAALTGVVLPRGTRPTETGTAGTPEAAGAAGSGSAGAAGSGPAGAAGSGPAGPRDAAGPSGTAGPGPGAAGPSGPRGTAAFGQAPSGGAMTEVAPSPAVPPQAPVPVKPASRATVARQRLAEHIQPADVTRGFAVRAADVWRQHRMEAIAVVLLALAGLIFPHIVIWPVGLLLWLIGLGFALTSKLWDPIDKWVSSVGPLALVIVGTALIVSADGKRSSASAYGHEAMNVAVTLFRIGLLLAAVYLAWRIPRGPRTATPPWVRRR